MERGRRSRLFAQDVSRKRDAATYIQCIGRGQIARQNMAKTRQNIEAMKYHNDAVIKIQALSRGRKGRLVSMAMHVKNLGGEYYVTKVQAKVRGKIQNRKFNRIKQNQAAAGVQCLYRGNKARMSIPVRNLTKRKIKLDEKSLSAMRAYAKVSIINESLRDERRMIMMRARQMLRLKFGINISDTDLKVKNDKSNTTRMKATDILELTDWLWSGYRPNGVDTMLPGQIFALQNELESYIQSSSGNLTVMQSEVERLRRRMRSVFEMAKRESHLRKQNNVKEGGLSKIILELIRATAKTEAAKPLDLSDINTYSCDKVTAEELLEWISRACQKLEKRRKLAESFHLKETVITFEESTGENTLYYTDTSVDTSSSIATSSRHDKLFVTDDKKKQLALLKLCKGSQVQATWGSEFIEWLKVSKYKGISVGSYNHDKVLVGNIAEPFGTDRVLLINFGIPVGHIVFRPLAGGYWSDKQGFCVNIADVVVQTKGDRKKGRQRAIDKKLHIKHSASMSSQVNCKLISILVPPGSIGLHMEPGPNGKGIVIKGYDLVKAKQYVKGGLKVGMILARIGQQNVSASSFDYVLACLRKRAAEPKRLTFCHGDTDLVTLAADLNAVRELSAVRRLQEQFRARKQRLEH